MKNHENNFEIELFIAVIGRKDCFNEKTLKYPQTAEEYFENVQSCITIFNYIFARTENKELIFLALGLLEINSPNKYRVFSNRNGMNWRLGLCKSILFDELKQIRK